MSEILTSAIRYLYSRQNLGIKLGLERSYALSEICGSPHQIVPAVQIVGTNGKGSTAAFLASILQEAGYQIGLSTSPHLSNVNERIRINGLPIPNDVITEFIQHYKRDIEDIGSSFFEILTVLSLWYFNREQVDLAVMETGLGGRLDSVTICQPHLVLVTSISYDHVEILGDTLTTISAEKAGAFKPGVPVITVKQDPEVTIELRRKAEDIGCPLTIAESAVDRALSLGIPGAHQYENADLARSAALELSGLPVSESQLYNGLARARWHGRYQVIQTNPVVIFDVGHNAAGIASFLNEFRRQPVSGSRVLILALQKRKQITELVPALEKLFDTIICTGTHAPNALPADDLAAFFTTQPNLKVESNPDRAIITTLGTLHTDDALVILGTHYLGQSIENSFKISFGEL